jgi:hypothetical protein
MTKNQVQPYDNVKCDKGHPCTVYYRNPTTPYGFPKDPKKFDYGCNTCHNGKFIDYEPCYHCFTCKNYDMCHGCEWATRMKKTQA